MTEQGEPPALRLVLKPGREKSVRNRHPWVFSGALAAIEGDGAEGAIGDLFDAGGEFLARGMVNPRSQIVFRALSFKKEPIDAGFLAGRIDDAWVLRRDQVGPDADAYRLVNGEGNLLPGLVVDRYADFLVCQFGAAGMDRLRAEVVAALVERFRPQGIWERSEGGARREEGLADRAGSLGGTEPPDRVTIREGELRFAVDLKRGHKTGFYLDQRPARALVGGLAANRRVLDVFAYSGGFAVAAAAGGATTVTAFEASEASLQLLPEHLALNQVEAERVTARAGDAFDLLRAETERYDLVVVDPPAFAKRKSEVQGACRGYKDVNLQAMRCLARGGLLVTSSCSYHVDAKLFQQVLFAAAKDAGRSLQILARFGQPPDHPVSIYHPEGEYLKVLVLRAVD